VHTNALGDRVARVLAAADLPCLTWLDLRNNRLTGAGLRQLLLSPLGQRLTWLDLQGNELDPLTWEGFAAWQQERLAEWPAPEGSRPRLINALGMQFVLIPAGIFVLGSPESEWQRYEDEGPQHEVTLTRPFYLGVFAVTQQQYEYVMGRNPSYFTRDLGGGPGHPVERVSWFEAREFCRRLSALPEEKRLGRHYRLPTEAEWEHACRCGLPSAIPSQFGCSFTSTQANFNGNLPAGDAPVGPYLERTTPVGSYAPSSWGLYDMHGNLWDWCADWYASAYPSDGPTVDPPGPEQGALRVLRGASWYGSSRNCRSACRASDGPSVQTPYFGLRLAFHADLAEPAGTRLH
jgi:formylglycine-generating enzyme required for sulfatase activity